MNQARIFSISRISAQGKVKTSYSFVTVEYFVSTDEE